MKIIKFNTLKYLAQKNHLGINQGTARFVSVFCANRNAKIEDIMQNKIDRMSFYINLN